MSLDQELDESANNLVEQWIKGYRRGSLRFFILHLLLYKERYKNNDSRSEHKRTFHGYHIAKVIEKITQGKWHPTTASIYPILKQFSEERIVEEVPDLNDPEGKRFTKKYRLTKFGIDVAEKMENARKDFGKSFAAAKKESLHISTMKIRHKMADKEILEFLDDIDLELLESEKDNMIETISMLQNTLNMIETEIGKRKKLSKKE
ncbi:MAG: PadR family transcriptional regulator [Candidatus Hodarchaeales archaeon]